jgi:hypothetical protein
MLTSISVSEGMVCGRCDRPATCALHDMDMLSTSSAIFFLCGEHLQQRLERHPNLYNHLLQKFGAKKLHSFYETA